LSKYVPNAYVNYDATNNLQSNALVSMPFYCYTWMMNSCCWAMPPYTRCNLNFYFLKH